MQMHGLVFLLMRSFHQLYNLEVSLLFSCDQHNMFQPSTFKTTILTWKLQAARGALASARLPILVGRVR